MSGTSADAMDAALVEWPEGSLARPFELQAYTETAYPESFQTRVHALAAAELPAAEMLRELIRIDREIADRSADAVIALVEQAGVRIEDIAGIASHGQTIAHHPELGGSLQIGCGARIAERTGRPVIADFRRRDLAMDGEGAPLAPFFHHAVFADPDEHRGVLNLGGIANLTWIPAGGRPEEVIAFDVGPANALLDAVMTLTTDGVERFDRDGTRARSGEVQSGWLEKLLADPFLSRPPPKSTGREHYGLAQATALLSRARQEDIAPADLLATLTEFSAAAIVRAWMEREASAAGSGPSAGAKARMLVGGGGFRNAFLIERIQAGIPSVPIEPMDAAGVPADAAEAMAFSLMGRNTLLGLPNQLPQCTGSAEARSLGVIHPAP